jgi:hypothetical protein
MKMSLKYYPQSSVTTWYSEEAGWPFGAIEDTDSIYEKEKRLEIAHPVREVHLSIFWHGQWLTLQANVLLVEMSKQYGITSFNLIIPNVCEFNQTFDFVSISN